MELEYKPDAAEAIARMDAWWHHAILDRPTIQVTAPGTRKVPIPVKHHASLRDRWMDVEYNVERSAAICANTYWGGEQLPHIWPNLGPEVLSAALGAELVFGEDTSWSVPILHDWADVPRLRFDPHNEYMEAIVQMTHLGLELGRGKFLVGYTDIHPGGDLAASLRDPQQLCLDCVEAPEQVEALMAQLKPTFTQLYTLQEEILVGAGQTIATSWLPLFATGRYYIPSCDFSCMVSPAMFQRLFLPEIVDEIEWLDRSIYHLDGPNALPHLDALLSIPKLDAIQFVYGAGNEPASRWMHVYRRIQKAGKNLHITVSPEEIPVFMEELEPEGVMLQTWCSTPQEAEDLIKLIFRWRPGRRR